MKSDSIIIRQAREHNLKNIDLTIPRNQFVVITGLSGSGKSSLAFDGKIYDVQDKIKLDKYKIHHGEISP